MPIAAADSKSYFPISDGEQKNERRRRHRLRLQLSVRFEQGGDLSGIDCTTRDISSDGFLCLTPRAFEKGETVVCVITWPTYGRGGPNAPFVMRCRARVVRCEYDEGNSLYRTACRIEEYECNHLRKDTAAAAAAT